jgi:hypothetical protein
MTKKVTCIELFRYALVPAPFTLHLLFLLLLFKRLRKTATLLKDYEWQGIKPEYLVHSTRNYCENKYFYFMHYRTKTKYLFSFLMNNLGGLT